MPGLNQLKQFNKDIQSLGDELTILAGRGEKIVKVPIPRSVQDVDDTEEFVLGMPELAAPIENSAVDEDLSDITGIKTTNIKNPEAEAEATAAYEAPDMSSLLNPIVPSPSEEDSGMPDLSMFMDAPGAVEEQEEEAPVEEEQVSVADMGFEDLLSGVGFDGSSGTEKENPEINDDSEDELIEEEPEEIKEPPKKEKIIPGAPLDINSFVQDTEVIPTMDDSISELEKSMAEMQNSFDEHFAEPEPIPEPEPEPIPEPEADVNFQMPQNFSPVAGDLDMPSTDDFSSSMDFYGNEKDDKINEFSDLGNTEGLDDLDFSNDALPQMDFDDSNLTSDLDNIDLNEYGINDSALSSSDSFDAPEESFNTQDAGIPDNTDFSSEEQNSDFNDMNFDSSSMDSMSSMDFPDDNFGSSETDEASDEYEFGGSAAAAAAMQNGEDLPDSGFGSDDFSSETGDEGFSDFDSSMTDFGEGQEGESEGPFEVFDTTGMDEDIDFGIQDTDSQLKGKDDFDLGGNDDFAMEGSDFEIPGFSDVDTAKDTPYKKSNVFSDKSGGKEKGELPPNTLSDEQYKQFLKNFNNYPLNVRLAFENLIVQDEFTDDAEFEIIEKILNKAPARQVAALLEKMLDISIPVPRDFEHRTAEEYEEYKKSLSYQLRNKIIPGILIGIVSVFMCWGLFMFGKNCIVNPIRATNLYKQGYALLEADEYPQAELKFDKAASIRMKKNWFFKYARGYRNKKQYQRAEKMYKNILYYFNHDKEAGIEYAQMELDDLENYERAEEIVRREVLDYHAQDKDGLLLLGDILLEWGTEKDPAKLEEAKNQYLDYATLYPKDKNIYNSRMMRYFIRTDNLAQVLPYKDMFINKEKSLSADDWTELSGYLLDKMYGPIAPSDEYLRAKIEDLRKMLKRAVSMNPENPNALFNLAKYFIHTNETASVETVLKDTIEKFGKAVHLKKKEIYKYIDSYRLLGENYIKTQDYLRAQEQYSQGIELYNVEHENAGFEGNVDVGHLFSDLADIYYFAAGDYDNAEINYQNSVDLGYDNSMIRYRMGYVQYKNSDYTKALLSFMKAGEGNVKEKNLMLAMGNTLYLRNDDYAAEGYYSQLIDRLDQEMIEKGETLYPQSNSRDSTFVTQYLYAANNYGVSLYNLAKRTGDSSKNAQAIVQLQQSLRAWDSLTRDQKTLVRMEGSNLAEENIKYITHPMSDFEPSIYIEIPKTLTDKEKL